MALSGSVVGLAVGGSELEWLREGAEGRIEAEVESILGARERSFVVDATALLVASFPENPFPFPTSAEARLLSTFWAWLGQLGVLGGDDDRGPESPGW